MQELLTNLIIQRLNEAAQTLKKEFFKPQPIKVARHFALDNLLPEELAKQIYQAFPAPGKMPTISQFGGIKLKYYHLKKAAPLLQHINAAIQDPRVVAAIEAITEIKNQVPDTTRFAGGISMLLKGYFINPHLDNSHDMDKKNYRTLNVLYYVSPDWCLENGGNYELWDEDISNRIVVPSLFNRLLVMETNRSSWHAVNKVLCKAPRCCIFNYYFSAQSPEDVEYFFNASSFKPRPSQKIRKAFVRFKERILKGLG